MNRCLDKTRKSRNADLLRNILEARGLPEAYLASPGKNRRMKRRTREGRKKIRIFLGEASPVFLEKLTRCIRAAERETSWLDSLSRRDLVSEVRGRFLEAESEIHAWLSGECDFSRIHRLRLTLKTLDGQWRMRDLLFPTLARRDASTRDALRKALSLLGGMSDLETVRRALTGKKLAPPVLPFLDSLPEIEKEKARNVLAFLGSLRKTPTVS